MALYAAEKGINIFLEKPMGLNTEEAVEIADKVKEKNVAIKMHLGGGIGFTTISPVFVRILVQSLKDVGAKTVFIIDGKNPEHGVARGYTSEVLGCQVLSCFGHSGKYYYPEPIDFKGLDEIFLSGEALDFMYDEADLAIGSLGRHRQNTNQVSTLKIKEFCARGKPFIYSNDEPTLNGLEEFALKVPANDSSIDFKKVIQFYLKVEKSVEIPKRMRKIAIEKYDWVHQIKIIHNEIQKKKSIK